MTANVASAATIADPEGAAELAGTMMEQMAEIPGIEPEALAETGAGMTANMASAAVQADPEGAADLAGAMMEVWLTFLMYQKNLIWPDKWLI